MMKGFILILTLALSGIAFCQSDTPDGSASLILPDYESALIETSAIFTTTSSGPASCGASSTDDVFYEFTAVNPGVEFVLNSGQFDGVLDLWDAGLTSLECINTAAGIGEEQMWFTQLVPGDTYYLRIHSADGVSGTGDFNLEYRSLPTRELAANYQTTSIDGDPFRIFDFLRRTSGPPIESSRWKFRNTADNSTYIYEHLIDFFQISINVVETEAGTLAAPFFCYGNTYEVSVETVIEGMGCGFGNSHEIVFQAEPNTRLGDAYISSFVDPSFDFIQVANTSLDQEVEWEFYEFGTFVELITTAQGQNRLYLNTSTNVLYNRAYTVRTRVTSCGYTGPWSDEYQIFTSDIPYANLLPGVCDNIYGNGAIVNCASVSVASGYFWQVAPIELNDPTFTPIGPAIVYESAIQVVSLVGLEPNTAYRISVKPIFGNGAQVGEYSAFCQIGTAGSGVGMSLEDTGNSNENTNFQIINTADKLTIYPNPAENGQINVTVPTGDSSAKISIYSSQGQLIHRDLLNGNSSIDVSSFAKGNYFIQVTSENNVYREKLIIQ